MPSPERDARRDTELGLSTLESDLKLKSHRLAQNMLGNRSPAKVTALTRNFSLRRRETLTHFYNGESVLMNKK